MNQNLPAFPGWETVRLIGRGSYGGVYEVRRDLFGKTESAAMKVLQVPQTEGDVEELRDSGYDDDSITAYFKEHLAALVNEYSLTAELKGHANTVHCEDVRYVQRDEGFGWNVYIRMELLTPIMKDIERFRDERQVIRLGMDMCSVLSACEKIGIIHRDIKPQNIFVSDFGDYKLGDFGIAKTISGTSSGTVAGTMNYMAPEVYKGQPYGHRVDLYSLGMVMYWLLNERRGPFLPLPPEVPKKSDVDRAFMQRMNGEEFLVPASGSEELKRIVLKACAYRPEDRFSNADEMLADLKALLSSEKSPAERTPVSTGKTEAYAAKEAEGTVSIHNPQAETVQIQDDGNATVGVFAKKVPLTAAEAEPTAAPADIQPAAKTEQTAKIQQPPKTEQAPKTQQKPTKSAEEAGGESKKTSVAVEDRAMVGKVPADVLAGIFWAVGILWYFYVFLTDFTAGSNGFADIFCDAFLIAAHTLLAVCCFKRNRKLLITGSAVSIAGYAYGVIAYVIQYTSRYGDYWFGFFMNHGFGQCAIDYLLTMLAFILLLFIIRYPAYTRKLAFSAAGITAAATLICDIWRLGLSLDGYVYFNIHVYLFGISLSLILNFLVGVATVFGFILIGFIFGEKKNRA